MQIRLTFFGVLQLVLSTSAIAQSQSEPRLTIEAIARSVSLFTAVSTVCSQVSRMDLDKANRYKQVYLDVGIKGFGKERFQAILLAENARRSKEVEITGRAHWCMYQQGSLEKLGVHDVFLDSEKSHATKASPSQSAASGT